MAGNDKLSAREAALIARSRAELAKGPVTQAAAASNALASEILDPPASAAVEHAAPALDPAARAAALMAAARSETERLRQRWRRLYLWPPVAFLSAVGLWMLLWIWYGR